MKPMQLVNKYMRRYAFPLVITVVSTFLLVGVQLLIPWIIKLLIAAVSDQDFSKETMNFIGKLSIVVLIAYIARGGLQFLRSYLSHLAGWGVVADVRKHIYEHIQRLSLRFYEDKQTGQMMSRVINDTDLFERLVSHAIPDVFVNALTFIGISVILFLLNWKLTLLSMIPIPLVIISLRIYARFVRPAFKNRQKELGDLNAILNDNISGIREIKAFTREEDQLRRVGKGIDSYRQSLLSALRLMAIYQPFVDFTSSLGILVVIFFGGKLALEGVLSVADLVAFFLYLEQFYQPVRNLGGSWEQVQESLAGADRVADLLKEQPELQTRKEGVTLQEPVQGVISFESVNFSYIPDELVLENISFNIPKHNVIALVGPTGVGKSTLVSLIPRFYDVQSGSIKIDGVDIRDVPLENLRKQVSIVLQDVFLFHGTAKENILFGKPDATDEEVVSAAKIANAHEFISNLPDGYDTLIGERGIKLSGGQKQRLSIARAVLKNSPILILDEATSSVDTETELLIQEALERLIIGKTTIIIAHRLSTVRNADMIIVLEGKHIVEMGTHQQLLAHDGLYKRLSTVQQHLEPDLHFAQVNLKG